MASESEPLESYYASNTYRGLIRSGLTLLGARRVKSRKAPKQREFHLSDLADRALFLLLIGTTALILELFQRLRTRLTGKARRHPAGAWQWYLQTGLREDLGHFTNETTGYQESHPEQATPLDDLTAWVMAVIQFLWNYEDLMGTVWDEWTLLRLINDAIAGTDQEYEPEFYRLQRKWEVARPYDAPLNGTYADVRRAIFEDFVLPLLEGLPPETSAWVRRQHQNLAVSKREAYQKQMSLLATTESLRFRDIKKPVRLWDACIGLVIGGRYYLVHVVDHDENNHPVVYDYSGQQWPLQFDEDGSPLSPDGEKLILKDSQFYRSRDAGLVGYLDMAPASRIKWQLRSILEQSTTAAGGEDHEAVDVLLAETPRVVQRRLRRMLPKMTQCSLEQLARAPVIINWDERSRDSSLAELRRAQRGVGDHALTLIRTESSFIFDQSHAFFDGAWSLAMAEVLTNAAVMWCQRSITLAPLEAPPLIGLELPSNGKFVGIARKLRQPPEISAETIIWDISNIFALRKRLLQTGTRLTVNDLLVITRIFHAVHYKPSASVQKAIDEFGAKAHPGIHRKAVKAILHSLQRGRVTNPALLIPVDASPTEPGERLFPITFRNLADNLVWIWDDTWDAYQDYRKHDPPNTPEGLDAFQLFALKRTLLVGNLRAFSYILDANKSVAVRGDSINVAIMNLLVGLPPWLQMLLKEIPEKFPALNEVIRGDEVYSNVGRVSRGSSLKRFMTAKDDGNTKALAWGVMSDDDGRLIVTMRDFRPHVRPLILAGRIDLANQMAQDYVVTYTADLIGLVARLSAMLQAEAPTMH
nr:hypothetical protein [Anaerolineae bacterium]